MNGWRNWSREVVFKREELQQEKRKNKWNKNENVAVCPECSCNIDLDALQCPHCGCQTEGHEKQKK